MDSKEAPLSTDTTPTNAPPVGPKAPLSTSTDHPSFTTNGNVPVHDSGLAVDVFPPWDIQSIQDGLGGRYDRDTIVDMLQKCRGDIDRAFTALLGEKNEGPAEKKLGLGPNIKPSLQVSRSSSPFSTGSKRSAEDSDDSDEPRPPTRRVRPKHRIVSNLTLGVGISFCDDQNEVVSLNLRVSIPYIPLTIEHSINSYLIDESRRREGERGKSRRRVDTRRPRCRRSGSPRSGCEERPPSQRATISDPRTLTGPLRASQLFLTITSCLPLDSPLCLQRSIAL